MPEHRRPGTSPTQGAQWFQPLPPHCNTRCTWPELSVQGKGHRTYLHISNRQQSVAAEMRLPPRGLSRPNQRKRAHEWYESGPKSLLSPIAVGAILLRLMAWVRWMTAFYVCYNFQQLCTECVIHGRWIEFAINFLVVKD